ncbi:PAS domain S-box protein [Massilia oculi]|uniref:PAS domain S-box protein n=1 Tax=Massilia hydrophila TaxID=3044279 RepID=A0ABS7Y757_9BURK|nr:PAS domain S-box protein [Massilia oculi]MCA1855506.1 PAS domain S-box protein [Massilia oculi]
MLVLTLLTLQLVIDTLTRQVEVDISRDLAELAFQTTDKLDRGMYERYREVKLMAERYEITNAHVPVDAKRKVLEDMQITHPYYAWIGLTDNRGIVRISTKQLLEGKDVSARPWFSAAYEGVHLHDVHEAVLLAKLLPNPGGEPKRFFDIAFPFRNPEGIVMGIFGTHLSWQWAADVQRSVLRPLAQRKGVDTLILSREGIVLLGPEAYAGKPLALESFEIARNRKNGSLVETWPDGKRYLVGYSQSSGHDSYPGLGWVVLVRQPLDQAFMPVEELRSKILWTGVGAAVVVSLLVWMFSRTIVRPLGTITRHADALRAGMVREIPPIRSRLTEVQILQHALNALLAKLLSNEQDLRDLNATLERRVTQRTVELANAADELRKGEQRVRAIIDTALDAFVGVDAAGRISDWNPRAEEIFGWRREEVLGMTVSETIIPSRFQQAHEAGMKRFSVSGSSGVIGRRLHLFALRRDGTEFPVEMTIGLINAGETHFFGTFIQDISERKRIEDALARERELLKAVMQSIDVGVVVCSGSGEVLMLNRAAKAIHARRDAPHSPEDWAGHYSLFLADGSTPMPPGDLPLVKVLNGDVVDNAELVVRPPGHEARHLLASGRPLHATDGASIGAVIAFKDVTAMKESARRLEASERKLRTITDNLPVLIGYIDKDGRYLFANATYEDWFGLSSADIVGKTVREVMGEEFDVHHQGVMQRNAMGETVSFEMKIPGATGIRIVEVTRIPDHVEGSYRGVYVLGADVSAARLHEEELSRLARIDTLTGLPNRRAYQERLEAALQRARRSGQGVALMFLDVDHFKQVNDTLGHAAGDTVLQEFARRVKGAVRVTDTVCRLAGDEFTVILEGLKSSDEAVLVGDKIVKAFARPFDMGKTQRRVSTSIGIAFASAFPVAISALEETADRALYGAKREGRGRHALLTLCLSVGS